MPYFGGKMTEIEIPRSAEFRQLCRSKGRSMTEVLNDYVEWQLDPKSRRLRDFYEAVGIEKDMIMQAIGKCDEDRLWADAAKRFLEQGYLLPGDYP